MELDSLLIKELEPVQVSHSEDLEQVTHSHSQLNLEKCIATKSMDQDSCSLAMQKQFLVAILQETGTLTALLGKELQRAVSQTILQFDIAR